MRQILWGLFKKIVIADNCSYFVNLAFDTNNDYAGIFLVIGAVLFSFQIYCDFSGYSDIAIGTARTLGFNLSKNFNYPYFSRDIAEFWRRWHISLTSWFKEYLYIPLGGSRKGKTITIRNVFVVFIASALWHGANFTFIIWGLIHALLYVPILLSNKNRSNLSIIASDTFTPKLKEVLNLLLTFTLVTLSWIFFRAESISHAYSYTKRMFTCPTEKLHLITPEFYFLILYIAFMIALEWKDRKEDHALKKICKNKIVRLFLYFFLIDRIIRYCSINNEFIYFQF